MGQIRNKLDELAGNKVQNIPNTVIGTVLNYNKRTKKMDVRFNNPIDGESIVMRRVEFLSSDGILTNIKNYKNRLCKIEFMGNSVNNPLITAIFDNKNETVNTSNSGAYVNSASTLSTEEPTSFLGLIKNYINEVPNYFYNDFLNKAGSDIAVEISHWLSTFKDNESGINIAQSNIKFDEDGNMKIFTANNTGLTISKDGVIDLYGKLINFNNEVVNSENKTQSLFDSKLQSLKDKLSDTERMLLELLGMPTINSLNSMNEPITVAGSDMPFYIYSPPSITPFTPVILAVHGWGTSGKKDSNEIAFNGNGEFQMFRQIYTRTLIPDAIVVFPTKTNMHGSWNTDKVAEMFKAVCRKYNFHGEKLYYGFSMGAINGPEIISKYGDFSRAVFVDAEFIKNASACASLLSTVNVVAYFGGNIADAVSIRNDFKRILNNSGKLYSEEMKGLSHGQMNTYSPKPAMDILLS